MLAALILAPLFSDHMVLQRGQINPVWGVDRPQQVVTLTIDGPVQATGPISVTTGNDGNWKLPCPELPVGGPYRLHIKGSSETVIEDVLVGEVWLASGQSNMEWKLASADGGTAEVEAAADPELRMFTVDQTASDEPLATATGAWYRAEPAHKGGFSAVGYHFAKELRQALGIPVGVINASWGGTRVEAWTSQDALRRVMDVDKEIAAIAEAGKNLPGVRAEYAARLDAWERNNLPMDQSNEGEPLGWAKPGFDDGAWPSLGLPAFWQSWGMPFNGCVWFRLTIDLPDGWAGHDVTLSLGAVDDFDTTYFNGVRVGATLRGTLNAHQVKRRYTVPGDVVKSGKNTIAVRVFDQFGDGGVPGPAPLMFAESAANGLKRIPLAGPWKYAIERKIPLVSGSVFATAPAVPGILVPQNNPGYLFNGMIAPLAGYGLRGVIWYQGESNADHARSYRDRFTAMIRDWRQRWGQTALPFYFVQLANYKATPGWPLLREAQMQTLSEPDTGMAVTIDIGNPADIHPRNKLDVGRRLARIARANTYGEQGLEYSGPVHDRIVFDGETVRIHWSHARGLRTRDGAGLVKGFEVAGPEGVYHAATGKIEGDTVTLSCPLVPRPAFIRYAWADNPETNLENDSALPALPFRTDML